MDVFSVCAPFPPFPSAGFFVPCSMSGKASSGPVVLGSAVYYNLKAKLVAQRPARDRDGLESYPSFAFLLAVCFSVCCLRPFVSTVSKVVAFNSLAPSSLSM